ncbi:MAG: ferritin-like domain-containing protein [Paracoccaceae bacterium]|nr:ferritin-like domain-containing protein [Paracoccaceae bacterium]
MGVPDECPVVGCWPDTTFECDLEAEQVACAFYREAFGYCQDVGDNVSMGLLASFLVGEEGHLDFLETQLALIERIGEERFAQLNASPMNALAGAEGQPPA